MNSKGIASQRALILEQKMEDEFSVLYAYNSQSRL
jgi:hypothetical protein